MKKTLLFIFLLYSSSFLVVQEVLKLNEGEQPAKATLSQLNWLVGYWKGEGFNGECDEIWMPQTDNTLQGIFRFSKEGKINFTEYIVIEEKDSTLALKLKHFSKDLSAWEEKEKWITFNLVKIENQTAYFDGLTYHREGDKLTISLKLTSDKKTWIEEFKFTKTSF